MHQLGQGCNIASHESQGTEVLPELSAFAALLDAQEVRLECLEATVARLAATCCAEGFLDFSKPPSSGHRQAAQAGVAGGSGTTTHRRTAWSPQARTRRPSHRNRSTGKSVDYRLDLCPCCGRDLRPMPTIEPRVIQQGSTSRTCRWRSRSIGAVIRGGAALTARRSLEAPWPIGVERGGLAASIDHSDRLPQGVCHASYSTVRKFIRDVVGVTISRPTGEHHRQGERVHWSSPMRNCWRVCRTKPSASMSMRPVTSRIGYGSGIRCFRADLYTLFKIDPTRSGDVLIEVLGKWSSTGFWGATISPRPIGVIIASSA